MKNLMRACVLEFVLTVSFSPIARSQSSTSSSRASSGPVHENQSKKKTSKQKTHAEWKGATARCRDGTLTYRDHRRGTCSHHGGMAEWNPTK